MPSSSRLPTRRAALITSTRVASGFTGELEAALLRLLGLARARVEADTAVVLLLDASGSFLDTIAADGLTLNVRQRARVRVGKGFAGSVAASQRPVVLDHVSDHNVVNPLLLRQGVLVVGIQNSMKLHENAPHKAGCFHGGPSGIRTHDTRLKRPLL